MANVNQGIVIPVTLGQLNTRGLASSLQQQQQRLNSVASRRNRSPRNNRNHGAGNQSLARRTQQARVSSLQNRLNAVNASRLSRQHNNTMGTGFGALNNQQSKATIDSAQGKEKLRYDRWVESLKKKEHDRHIKRIKQNIQAIKEDEKRTKAKQDAHDKQLSDTERESREKVKNAQWIQKLKDKEFARTLRIQRGQRSLLIQETRNHRRQEKLLAKEKAIQAKKGAKAGSMLSTGVLGAVAGAGIGLGAVVTATFAPAQDYLLYENMMLSVSDGQEQFNDRMKMTKDLAHETGQNMVMLGKEYAKFSASNPAVGGMTEGEMSSGFGDVARLTTIRGGKQEDISLAMKALTQMLSKGKISAEELRGQLGERMAGSFKLFAEGMGMTVGELDKAMKEGQVFSAEALPKFFARLRTEIETSSKFFDTATHAIGRYQNALAEASGEAHKAGWDNGIANAINGVAKLTEGMGNIFTAVAPQAQSFGRILNDIFTDVALTFNEIAYLIMHYTAKWGGEDQFQNVRKVGEELTEMEKVGKNLVITLTTMAGLLAGMKLMKFVGRRGKNGKLKPEVSDLLIALRTGGIKGMLVFGAMMATLGFVDLWNARDKDKATAPVNVGGGTGLNSTYNPSAHGYGAMNPHGNNPIQVTIVAEEGAVVKESTTALPE